MATVILIRHGRTTANASGLLAGRTPGIELDDVGYNQVAATGARLATVPLRRVVTSPLERCKQTTASVMAAQTHRPELIVDEAVTECDYGDWQGRALADLVQEDLWSVVQHHPSDATFPGGESMRHMQDRALTAVRSHDAAVEADHGPEAIWALVSHGDVLKSILADAYAMHLDHFQRVQVDPASVSIVRYGSSRPHVINVNTASGDLRWLATPPEAAAGAGAQVGGGAGPATPTHDAGPRS